MKWETIPLASVCKVFADGDWIESKDQSETGVRLVQTGNVGEGVFKDRAEKARYVSAETFQRLRCTEIFPGDCLISRLPDPVGRACIIPDTGEAMITAVDCTIVRFREGVYLPEFFTYYSQSLDYLTAVDAETTGTTRKRISRARLGQVAIPATPLPEQRRIVAILDAAFEAIATAKANTEKNVENAQSILSRRLADRFSQTGSDWGRGVLRDLTTKIGSGATPLGGEAAYKQQGIALVRSLNVHDRGFRYGKLAFLDEEQAARLANVQLQTDDVLLNITGASVARSCVLPADVLPARVNQHVSIIRPKKGVLDSEFLHWLLIAPPNKERLLGIGTGAGATRQAITKAEIEAFEIKYPGYEEQQAVAADLEQLALATDHVGNICTAKLAALDELKKSLLHQAFTGGLTAESTDKQLAEVA